jgi:cell division protein FtsL
MATPAFLNRFLFMGATREAVRANVVPGRDERFKVRRIPNENIYFFAKTIDNSRVVRERDPKTRGSQWRLMAATLGGAALLITVLLPSAYTFIAGHEMQDLRQKREQLLAERRRLEVEEAKLLTPARLEQYAENQKLTDPGNKVVFLGDKGQQASLRPNQQH